MQILHPQHDQVPTNISDRLQALDFLKGYAMLWITFVHLGSYWGLTSGPASWVSLWRFLWVIMDWLGPTIFIIVTVFGTMLSIQRKEMTNKKRGMFKQALRKFTFMFAIGEIMNLIIDSINTYKSGPWHVLGMNMITAIAFAQLLVYGLVKLRNRHLLAVLVTMALLFIPLFLWSYQGVQLDNYGTAILEASTINTPQTIIYFIFFYMEAMIPAYSWILLSVASVLVFRGYVAFHRFSQKRVRFSSPDHSRFLAHLYAFHARRFAIIGVALTAMAVTVSGWFLLLPGEGFTSVVFRDLTSGDPFSFWFLPGVPLFLIRHTPQYIFYNLGIFLLHFSILFYYMDVKRRPSRVMEKIRVFGKYSFSVFMYSHVFKAFPFRLELPLFLTVLLVIILLFVYLTAWWDKKGGILSLEWGLEKYVSCLDVLERRLKSKHGTKGKKM